ncbi:MAG: chorismate synthase, partial [Clostridiales bacterium]|nr:chorismate synthase [Clostridiales bacterium]
MSNRLGNALKVTVFGQSHAPSIGAVIEGLPAGLALDMAAISDFMGRRAPGRSDLTTPRREADSPRVIAGLNDRGLTCGSPLCVVIDNGDTRSRDYDQFKRVPRPGHADYPSRIKFGDGWDVRGGGQFSGRLTAPLCFAGAIALQMLEKKGVTLWGHLLSVGDACDR